MYTTYIGVLWGKLTECVLIYIKVLSCFTCILHYHGCRSLRRYLFHHATVIVAVLLLLLSLLLL